MRLASVFTQAPLCGFMIHFPGDYPNISIFCHAFIFMLDGEERVEADDGYRSEYPRQCKIPDLLDTFHAASMRQHVMQEHETVNKRFKNF